MNSSVCKKVFERPLVLALCMNAIMLVLSFWLGAHYSSLDDFFMQSVLVGAYGGEYDVHLYFINVIYGYFLWPFYKLFPALGWYSFFETLSMFVSFTAISYVLLHKLKGWSGLVFAILLVACASPEFYFHVAFTQCAAALTAAGFLFVIVGGRDGNKKQLGIGVLMMVAGSVFRREMFLLVLPALALTLGLVFLRDRRIYKSLLVALLCCFAIEETFKEINAQHYQSGDYDYYAAYQPARSTFGDGAYFDGDDVADEMDERGLHGRDYKYLKAWYFYDKDVFSLDSLNAVRAFVNRNKYIPNYPKFPIAAMAEIANKLAGPIVWCWLLLCVAIICYAPKRNGVAPWLSIVLLAIPYFYLLLVNRVVGHVVSGVWLYAITFLIPFVETQNIRERKHGVGFCQIIVLISIVGISLPIAMAKLSEDSNSAGLEKVTSTEQLNYRDFVDYAQNRPDDVFVLPFGRYKQLAKSVGVTYKAVTPGSWNNIFSTGYWNIHLPAMEKELQKRGVQNVLHDVVNSNVYVMCDDMSISLAPFYFDHYHQKLDIDTVQSFGELKLLKYQLRGDDQ